MLTRVLALCGLVFSVGLIAADEPKLELKEYTSKEGKYKVSIPGVVKVSEKKPTPDMPFHFATSEVAPGKVFTISYFDLPAELAPAETKTLFATLAGSAKEDGGKLISDKEATVGRDKLPGRDFLIEKDKSFLRQRVVVSGKRVYQVMVTGPKDFVTAKDVDKYIESFEVTK